MNHIILEDILSSEQVFVGLRSVLVGESRLYDHTIGIVERYKEQTEGPSSEYYLGLFACLFHEIGKPLVEMCEWSEERGIYKTFDNYEVISSRLAEDIMVRWGYTPMQIYRVCWLIENQNRFNTAYTASILEFNETIHRYIGLELFRNFTKALRDTYLDTSIPFRDFEVNGSNKVLNGSQPKRVYFPIAASASGKSTICEQMLGNAEYLKTRFDSLRKELYSENGKYDYWHCIAMSYQDENWNRIADDVYLDMLNTNKTILFDNCNVLRSDRENQIKLAREYGYEVIALTIPIDFITLKYRQDHRRTKLTPWKVSEDQYMELQQPSCSNEEFDYIIPLNYR